MSVSGNNDSTVESSFGAANALFTPFDSSGVANGGFSIASRGSVDPLTKAPSPRTSGSCHPGPGGT